MEKNLNDDTITSTLVKRMKTNLLIKEIPSDINDTLTRIKLGRTLYGPQGVHAGILDDPWCSLCQEEDNLEIEDSLAHHNYNCPHIFPIIREVSKYFFDTTPSIRNYILGATNSPLDRNIDKQYGCLIASLVFNYCVHMITTRRRANQVLVGTVIIKNIISKFQLILLHYPSTKLTGILQQPNLAHFLILNDALLPLE